MTDIPHFSQLIRQNLQDNYRGMLREAGEKSAASVYHAGQSTVC